MSKHDALIRYAITPPRFDPGKLHREQLVDAIHANIPRKLIAIAAPAGYGKSTLLSDFAQHSDLPVCWLRVTEADRDVLRLTQMLSYSLQRRFRRLRGELEIKGLSNISPEALANLFVRVINEHVPEPFVIAMDDVHLVNRSRTVLQFLDSFLENLPEQVTVITVGREVMEVSLAKLLAEGDLAGFGPHNLALTTAEMRTLVIDLHEKKMSDEQMERLYHRTRGWVTGVILSGEVYDSGLGAIMESSDPLVYEYLASAVLHKQSKDMQLFMLHASILPIMTVDFCDRVLEHEESQQKLIQLVREGLFITIIEDNPQIYEFHPLFREFLIDTIQKDDPGTLQCLRKKAADYLKDQGLIDYAIDLYFEAGSADLAGQLADANAPEMFQSGRIATLEEWGKRLKQHQVNAPRIFLYIGKAFTDTGELDQAEKWLDFAESMLKDSDKKTVRMELINQRGLVLIRKGNYQGAIDLIEETLSADKIVAIEVNLAIAMRVKALSHYYLRDDLDAAESLAQSAISILEKSGTPYDVAVCLADLYAIHLAKGKLLEAHITSQRSHAILSGIGAPLPMATSFNNLAFYAHMHGDYEDAIQLFREGLKYARQASSASREAFILFGMADLFNDMGLMYQAGDHYENGLRISTRINNPSLLSYGCLQTSVLHRRRGGGNIPHQWLQRAVTLGEFEPTPVSIRIQLAALESISSPAAACETLTAILAETDLDAPERTLAEYFFARATLDAGNVDETIHAFEKVLESAAEFSTEQQIAAELLADPIFFEFTGKILQSNSIMTSISQKIKIMKVIAAQYADPVMESVVEDRLHIRILGDIYIARGTLAIEEFRPLTKEILIYLIDHQRVDRDVLLEAFWPELSHGRQVSNLHTAVYILRRALGKDLIMLDSAVYFINPDTAMEYDVARFERAANIAENLMPGDPRRYFAQIEAINSYTGEFMPDVESDWVEERRRILEAKYLELLVAHAEEALVRDQCDKAIVSLRSALKIDPYRDDINYQYIEALGRLERRSEIVSHYQRYMRLLSEDLGLDPPESLRNLYSRLLG